jgi:hypothetical protein
MKLHIGHARFDGELPGLARHVAQPWKNGGFEPLRFNVAVGDKAGDRSRRHRMS